MVEKEKKLNLSELIDIKFLQNFQDIFAKTTNVASIMVDGNGPITKPSNFTDFCIKHTRGSSLGYKRCNECDIECGKIAAKTGEPAIYTCHSGLTDFAVPIIVKGEHIGSILGGQVLTVPPDEEHYRKIARELDINEDEYIEALREIKIVPLESVKAAADLLFFVANTISDISLKNLELIEKSERENLDRRITEAIRSSTDIEDFLSFICEETAKTFKVQRAAISVFPDLRNTEKIILRKEYKESEGLLGLDNMNDLSQISKYWEDTLSKTGDVLAIENMTESDTPEFFKNNYLELGVKSMLGIGISQNKKVWGKLILSDYKNYRQWTNDEITQLKIISNQIHIALNQAELYSALKQTTSNQNAILNNMPFMAWLKDDKGKLLAVNEIYAKMCDTTVENIIGKTDFDFFPKEAAEMYVQDDNKVMEKGRTVVTEEAISGPDGEKWHETIKSPVFDGEGNIIGTVGMARDITERKKIEKMKNEFISTVSHELRTPLTSIKGALGLVTSGALGVLPDKISNLIDIANNNCTRLTNLINDILDLEKIKAGKYEFKNEELEINSIIEQSVTLNKSYADQFGMKLNIINSIEETYIKADKNRLLQVMSNLISNAVKFSKMGGEVTIISELLNDKIKISVIDKGIGIPEDSKNKIFKSFSQVDSSDTRSKGGTGLGLSISKLIIEKMNGEIGFESKEKKGSIFFFILPTITKGTIIKSDDGTVKELSTEIEAW